MTHQRIVVALGANLGDSLATLNAAVQRMAVEIGPVVAASRWHETPAMIHPDDPAQSYPAFLNGCVLIETRLEPEPALASLHAIEVELGRDRSTESERWRPRLIDLDLIAWDEAIIDRADLQVPHPGMHERRFVLEPFVEVWPDWLHPRLGRTATELLETLP